MSDDTSIPGALSLRLFRSLLFIRRAEEIIMQHYPENEMTTPMHMSMGQEAVPVAICAAVGDAAQVISSYRSHAAFLARTGDLVGLLAEFYGRVAGCAEGKGGSMHLSSPERGHLCSTAIVGAGLPVAAGAAFAAKRLGTGNIVTVFFGDGAVEEGSFWETMNIGKLKRLPIIFICEDNGYAVHTPPHARQSLASLRSLVESFDMEYVYDDSNDVESLYNKARHAADVINRTGGPVFFHARCYRYLEHVGIGCDLNEGYRSREEFEHWKQRDCIGLQRRRLIESGYEEQVMAIESEIDAIVHDALRTARMSPPPGPERLFHGVFHEKN
jgi:TPP-dependent pyruvate/acetoin dehydrogenase alpha subunit